MQYILTNAQIQSADKYTIETLGVKGELLMESAGKACAEQIMKELSCCTWLKKGIVLSGKGNNGGDGYVIARYLKAAGFNVGVWTLADEKSLKGDALFHYKLAKAFGVDINHFQTREALPASDFDFVVDTLLGTGSKGAARGVFVDLINWINDQEAFVFAIDIPSGLNGDSSSVSGAAVFADHTLAIHTQKIAHVMLPAREYCGEVVTLPIGISDKTYKALGAKLFEIDDLQIKYPRTDDHKYSRGEVLLVGGALKMIGAIHWASRGAMHSGAGYVTLAVPESSHSTMKILNPSAVSLPLPELHQNLDSEAAVHLLKEHLVKTRAILIGNGIGRSAETKEFMETFLPAVPKEIPVIVDADGLYLVKDILSKMQHHSLILTPHLGELRHLFGNRVDLEADEKDRWSALQKNLAPNWILIAKGSPTVVITTDEIWINSTGGEELAIAGSGDLLAGYLAGLCAFDQDRLLYNCCQANFVHGYAGYLAKKEEGIFGVTMEKLTASLPAAIRDIEKKLMD